jgi:hypothetical protein
MAEGQNGGLRILSGRRYEIASGRQKRRTVVREIMIVFSAVLALGVIVVGVISALIVEKTPSQASAGAFPCNSPDVIAAAEKAIGIKKGPSDDLNLRNARDVRYDEAHDVMFCRVDLFRGNVIVNDYKYPIGFTFMAKAPSSLLVEPSITVTVVHLPDGRFRWAEPGRSHLD